MILLEQIKEEIDKYEKSQNDDIFVLLGILNMLIQNMEDGFIGDMQTYTRLNHKEFVTFMKNNLNNINVKNQNLIGTKVFSFRNYVSNRINKFKSKLNGQVLNTLNNQNLDGAKNFINKEKSRTTLVSNVSRIYRTENTINNSKQQLSIQEQLRRNGKELKRVWLHSIHNPNKKIVGKYTPRQYHIAMSGQHEDSNGLFHSPSGAVGKAPGLMDDIGDNINCRCVTYFDENIVKS